MMPEKNEEIMKPTKDRMFFNNENCVHIFRKYKYLTT